jgi:hypothetical protein
MLFGKQIARGGTVVALAVLFSSLVSPLASAATANPSGAFNFAVSPPSVAIQVKPGVTSTLNVRIQNQGIANENVKVTLMKFTADGETGLPNLRAFEATDDFSKWAQLSPTTFTAEPNVWKTVTFTLTPPKDAAFGYYYALVFSRQGAEAQTQKASSSLLGAVASLILVDVKAPGARRQINIAEFSTGTRSGEFLPVEFNVRLHNTGNTHVGVRGTINISQRGKPVADIDVNSTRGYILPGSYRNFVTNWKDGTPVYQDLKDAQGKVINDADGKPKQKLVWSNFSASKLRFGKYDARLIVIYDDGNGDVSTEARLSFWVMPWRIIAALTVIFLLVVGGLWAFLIRPLVKGVRKSRGYAVRR